MKAMWAFRCSRSCTWLTLTNSPRFLHRLPLRQATQRQRRRKCPLAKPAPSNDRTTELRTRKNNSRLCYRMNVYCVLMSIVRCQLAKSDGLQERFFDTLFLSKSESYTIKLEVRTHELPSARGEFEMTSFFCGWPDFSIRIKWDSNEQ